MVALVCPWCGVASHTTATRIASADRLVYLGADCRSAECGRGSMLVVPAISVGMTVMADVFPSAQRPYKEPGVPPDIAKDFEEALGCQASGYNFAAALVARRVLQAMARDVIGTTGANLAAEINAIPGDKLSKVLKDAAHQVRLIGNDAAHANTIDRADVEELMVFTEQLLETLYVIPARVLATQAKRTPAAKPAP